jgi:hypothetical protein
MLGMVYLPNRPLVDIRKLEDYCLDPEHPRGRHKARVFRDALGIGRADAAWLREILIDAPLNHDATAVAQDAFGSRWRIDVPVARQGRSGVLRSLWMIRAGESDLRFVTCWVQ